MGLKEIMDWLSWQNAQTDRSFRSRMKERQDALNKMGRPQKDALDAKQKAEYDKRRNSFKPQDSVPLDFPVSPGLEHMFTYQGGDLELPLHQRLNRMEGNFPKVMDMPYAPDAWDFLESGQPKTNVDALKNKTEGKRKT